MKTRCLFSQSLNALWCLTSVTGEVNVKFENIFSKDVKNSTVPYQYWRGQNNTITDMLNWLFDKAEGKKWVFV